MAHSVEPKTRTFDRAWSEIDPSYAVIKILSEIEEMSIDEFLDEHGAAVRERIDLESVDTITEEAGFVQLCIRCPKWTLTFTKTQLKVECVKENAAPEVKPLQQ